MLSKKKVLFKRLSWDEYFMRVADNIAKRSSCSRALVGAVLVVDNRIISHGYNGSVVGDEHCCDVGCIISNGHCVRVVHAEVNALLFAHREFSSTDIVLYCTHLPCFECAKLLVNFGVKRVVFRTYYHDNRAELLNYEDQIDFLAKFKVEVERLP